MTGEKSLAETIAERVSGVADGIDVSLKRHLSALPSPPSLSKSTKKHVAKRVSPSKSANYQTPEKAISLISMEIVDLGLRISRYQFIERYREHFHAPNPEMRAAFVMHTHILRGSEIYIIMERCVTFLDFFYDLAVDLSLNPKPVSKVLETRFKKDFEGHLRERHRIVHAHEKPSLVSRLMSISPNEMTDQRVADTFKNVVETFASMIIPKVMAPFEIEDPTSALERINQLRLNSVDEECLNMWAILLEAITNLIDKRSLLAGSAPTA